MYIAYIFTIGIYIYICTYVYIAYISSHSKGPEQEQLRSPFVPYVRNTAERSIHNFDSQPYILYDMQMDGIIREVHFNLPGFRLQIHPNRSSLRPGMRSFWWLGPQWVLASWPCPPWRSLQDSSHPRRRSLERGCIWPPRVTCSSSWQCQLVTVLSNVTQPQKIKVTGHLCFLGQLCFLLGLRGCPIYRCIKSSLHRSKGQNN